MNEMNQALSVSDFLRDEKFRPDLQNAKHAWIKTQRDGTIYMIE